MIFKVLPRWKFSNFGFIASRSGSRRRKRTDAHFSCVLLTGNKSRKSEVGVLQVKRPKITKIQVRNRIDRYDFMKISSKIKRRSASIHIILKKFIPLAVRFLIRDPLSPDESDSHLVFAAVAHGVRCALLGLLVGPLMWDFSRPVLRPKKRARGVL